MSPPPRKTEQDVRECKQVCGPARNTWAARHSLTTPTRMEQDSFRQLIDALTRHSMLTYPALHRQLFFDVDASIEGIGVMVYHVKDDALKKIKDDDTVVPCRGLGLYLFAIAAPL
ncbi:hypothetical protein NLG97_g10912 [Lecanicillium saksenae]|uniref:Uncharacterized protein n=1 Tax=Lecanicillium saksenae TaxID=468837 RepID=A0ACC1QDN8_9HYPO|nr:hypothetical protein NLG97_g10912 [Lecanicillium saksenae]